MYDNIALQIRMSGQTEGNMIGLEYILELYRVQHKDLAEELGIRKQNINMWIKGKKKIPQKYLPILAEKYGMPVEYFQKELTDIDKRRIDLRYAEIEVDNTTVEYTNVVIDEETGQKFEVSGAYYDSGAIGNYRIKEAELKEAKALNRIRGIINDMPEPNSIDEFVNMYESNIEIFDRFAKAVEGFEYKREVLYFIEAMEKNNSNDANLKKKLLSAAEQHISKEMLEEFSLADIMYAAMLLYEKDGAEFRKEFEE